MSSSAVDISPSGDGALLKEVRRQGQPGVKPWKGDRVTVHYVGTLAENGEQFDSSRDRGQPFNFNLGKSEVIRGWDEGVATMEKGEVAFFTIKWEKKKT